MQQISFERHIEFRENSLTFLHFVVTCIAVGKIDKAKEFAEKWIDQNLFRKAVSLGYDDIKHWPKILGMRIFSEKAFNFFRLFGIIRLLSNYYKAII